MVGRPRGPWEAAVSVKGTNAQADASMKRQKYWYLLLNDKSHMRHFGYMCSYLFKDKPYAIGTAVVVLYVNAHTAIFYRS